MAYTVLHSLALMNRGGAETFIMKVYRVIRIEEYQFDFIVSKEGGCYTQEVLERGGKVYKIPLRTKKPLGALSGIWKIVKENEYSYVVKLGDSPISVLDLIAAKLGGAKRLAMRSCNALTGLSWWSKCVNALFRPMLNAIANVKIAPSAMAAEFTFGKYHAHQDVHLLHNGLDLDVFSYNELDRYRIREEFNLGNKLVIGHVGRLHKQKNHRYLLEVFLKIREYRDDAVLMLVGIGKLEKEIRELTITLGLKDSVIFTGQRFDIPQLMSAMDVFVFPSLHEGMPNTVIEAQAMGLPCVIADTITSEANITGLVSYMPLNAEKENWAKKVLSVITEERRRTKEEFIKQGYDIESVSKKLIGLIFD